MSAGWPREAEPVGLHLSMTEVSASDGMRAHLAAIVDSSDDAILSKTLDGTILSWSRGAVALYGYTAEEIVGQPVSRLVSQDRPSEVEDILARIRAGESSWPR